MKPIQISFPLTKDIKIPATIQIIKHRDKTISAIMRTVIDDGKPIKLEAKAVPQKTIAYLFRSNIEVLNSWIEANKYVEVRVGIPKEGCDKCPLLHLRWEQGLFCGYLNTKIENNEKNKDCPALKE